MGINQSKKIAQDYFAAYEGDDPDALMCFLHSDYILYPGGDGKPMNAKERRQDETVFFSAFSHITVSIEDQIAESDKVANRITMSGIHTGEYRGISATRKKVIFPYIDILQIKDGKIVREWVEFDAESILRQIKA
jgi:predicted ester cyclase